MSIKDEILDKDEIILDKDEILKALETNQFDEKNIADENRKPNPEDTIVFDKETMSQIEGMVKSNIKPKSDIKPLTLEELRKTGKKNKIDNSIK